MRLTKQERKLHQAYEQDIGQGGRDAVNFAFDEVRGIFASYGVTGANDDRAEALVAALARYWIESGGYLKPQQGAA